MSKELLNKKFCEGRVADTWQRVDKQYIMEIIGINCRLCPFTNFITGRRKRDKI